MAAPAFGFSFGDFVSAISILNSIRKALRETGGAKDDFRNICSEMEHLEVLLEQLHCGTWDHGADAGHLNAVKGMALAVKIPLQEFLGRVEKFRSMMTGLDGTRTFSDVRHAVGSKARQAQWAVQMKDEVEKFRAVIVAKIVAINLLLQINLVSTTSKIESRTKIIEEHSSKCRDAVDGTANRVQELKASQVATHLEINRLVHICAGTKVGVQDIRRAMKVQHLTTKAYLDRIRQSQQQSLIPISRASGAIVKHVSRIERILLELLRLFGGFTETVLKLLHRILKTDVEIYALLRQIQNSIMRTPGLMVEDCLKFTDALGRTQQLAYQWFRHWDVFQSMLKCEFRGLPGEDRVLKGQYLLLKGRQQQAIIDREQWENSVFPGSDVGMSMIVDDGVLWVGICPRPGCGARNTSSLGQMGTVICYSCQLECHCVATLETSEAPKSAVSEGSFEERQGQLLRKYWKESKYPTQGPSRQNMGATLVEENASPTSRKRDLKSFRSIHIRLSPLPSKKGIEEVRDTTENQIKTLKGKEVEGLEAGLGNSPMLDLVQENNPEPVYENYWTWECHYCGMSGMTTKFATHCTEYTCNHRRCSDCHLTQHKWVINREWRALKKGGNPERK